NAAEVRALAEVRDRVEVPARRIGGDHSPTRLRCPITGRKRTCLRLERRRPRRSAHGRFAGSAATSSDKDGAYELTATGKDPTAANGSCLDTFAPWASPRLTGQGRRQFLRDP